MDNWTRDHGREEDPSDNKALDISTYDVSDCSQIRTSNFLFDNKKSKYC